MKVVQYHSADDPSWGGGVIAMLRLHAGLRRAGIDSQIVTFVNTLRSPHTHLLRRRRRLETLLSKVSGRLGLNYIHSVGTFGIKRHPVFQAADVLHVHAHVNYLALPGMVRRKPVALTLHDMWPFTGHCAQSHDCERWKTGCGSCPHLSAPPAVRRDATAVEWRLKRSVYERAPLTVVAPSQWMTTLAGQGLLAPFPVHHIPHGVDTDVYRPLDPQHCRSLLGIPRDRKVLMWLATRVDPSHDDARGKGAEVVLACLQRLPEAIRRHAFLLVVGKGSEWMAQAAGVPSLSLGFVTSDHLKAIAYSAAHLVLFPSRAETFGLVPLESLACGTPVVAMRVGGVPEVVRHGVTGYLAAAEDVTAFSANVARLLHDDARRKEMGRRCREIAVAEYPLDLCVERHVELYRAMARLEATDTPQRRRTGTLR
jgi:glycosyltransferase involved in cell wall biosynthesis